MNIVVEIVSIIIGSLIASLLSIFSALYINYLKNRDYRKMLEECLSYPNFLTPNSYKLIHYYRYFQKILKTENLDYSNNDYKIVYKIFKKLEQLNLWLGKKTKIIENENSQVCIRFSFIKNEPQLQVWGNKNIGINFLNNLKNFNLNYKIFTPKEPKFGYYPDVCKNNWKIIKKSIFKYKLKFNFSRRKINKFINDFIKNIKNNNDLINQALNSNDKITDWELLL